MTRRDLVHQLTPVAAVVIVCMVFLAVAWAVGR